MDFLIDIIVPVYNVGEYLPTFFDSLLKQTFQSFKLIVVYDESNDNSLEILKEYQETFKSRMVIIYSKERKGLGNARNVALDSGLITAKYFSFLDPDDYILPNFYESLVDSITKHHSDIAFVGFERRNIETGKTLSIDMVHNPEVINQPSSNPTSIYLNTAVWNKLYLTSRFSDIRFDAIQRSEDTTYFVRTISRAEVISFVNEPLYVYSIRSTSLAQSFELHHLQEILDSIKLLNDEINVKEHYNFVCGLLFLRICIGANIRIYSYNKKNYKEARRTILRFMNKTFPKWYKTKFISFNSSRKNGKKAFALFLLKKLYRLNMAKPFFRHYVKKSKDKEIHW